MITFAKGVTSGAAPLGGVLVREHIHEAFMQGPEHVPELAHGFTYSGHPLGVADANAMCPSSPTASHIRVIR